MTYKEYLQNKYAYQEDGHLFLLEKKHACLFYKPGKGKTYPCVDAMRDVDKMKNGEAKILILSTADAIKNMWKAEIEPQNVLPKNTVMMSFNAAIVDTTKIKLTNVQWDVIVIDESHKIKAHNTKSSKLVYRLAKKAEYVWGLSGTPRGNNDIDIYCQFHNMCVSEWGDISYTQFVEQCCDVDKKFFGGQCVRIPIGINEHYRLGWDKNIANYTQRIGYSDEDDMPDLNINVVKIPYKMSDIYHKAEQGVIAVEEYENTMTKLSAVLKLHQAVNGFLYIPNDDGDNVTYRFEHNKKLDWLNDNLTNEPVVIVYRFQADFEDICKQLDKMQKSYTEDVEQFKKGKASVLLLQCARCESFNLQMCNHIVFYTLDYSYIKYNQMLHRVWRMGQKSDVQIDVLLFDNTVETKIWGTITRKEKFADLFMSIKGV